MPAPVRKKNPAAVALGRKGGKKGGLARAANLTPAQRSASARKAVQARWAKSETKRNTVHPLKSVKAMPAGDTSDHAFLSLLKRYKATNDPSEMQKLSEQIERTILQTIRERPKGLRVL